MKKLLFPLLLFASYGLHAQQSVNILGSSNGEPQEKCRAAQVHERLMQTDPAYVQRRQLIEAQYETLLRDGFVNKTTYTIPVVVHVIHTGQAVGVGANISDAQIQSAIDNLNAAYSNTDATFTDYTGSNTNIQFCLAQRDASGNPTTGIVRVNGSAVTQYSTKGICDAGGGTGTDNEVAVKALSKWDNTKYYNFWIVTEINDNNAGAGTQGYAYFPGAGSSLDGAVMMYNAFGYDPGQLLGYNLKTYTDMNVTAVHEVGHALNLYHTFQGDGTGSTCPTDALCGTSGDCVADTPRHKRSTSSCVADATVNACQGGTTAADYQHNFMDYSSDDCQTRFTPGQITRMNAVMTGSRASLNASDGCNPVYTRDVGVSAILTPNVGTCGTTFTPEIRIKNFGSGTLTSFTINYNLDGTGTQTQAWTGTLTSGSTVDVALSAMTTTAGAHTFNAYTTLPNGLADQYATNDDESYAFTVLGAVPTAASCSPTTTETGNYNTGITRVQFNTLDHAHTDNDNDGLQDFTCTNNTTVSTNTSYTLTVTLSSSSEYCIAWIDYDDDGVFEAGEKVLNHNTGGTSATSHSISVAIPQYPAVTGKLIRMRIMTDFNPLAGDGCTDTEYGEIEDYSIFITSPPCVAPTINTHPSNLVSCDPATGTFTCTATGPGLGYQWQVDNGGGFANVSNGGIYSGATTATLSVTGATSAQNGYIYRCYVTTACGNATTNTATLNALTAPTATCTLTNSSNGSHGTGIARFQFNTIDRVHNDGINDGTQNFTCTNSTTVNAGGTYAFTVTGVGGNPEYCKIFIDYNNNGVFTDAGETVFTNTTTKLTSHTGNITIPTSGISTGLLRMRVITDFNNPGNGCNNLSYGEAEDYGIYVPCLTPTVTGVTSASRCGTGEITLSATPSAGTINWFMAPTGGTTGYTGTSIPLVLSSSKTYYAEAYNNGCVSAARTAVTATINFCSQVQASQCGVTLANSGTVVIADAALGATHYRFEITGPSGGPQYVTKTTRTLYLANFTYTHATTYGVKVAVSSDGTNFSAYGSSCNITTPGLPASQVQASQCGSTLATASTAIIADAVTGATHYRFEINGGAQTVIKTTRTLYLANFDYSFGSTYAIRVAASDNGTTFGSYGASCNITAPAAPATQVQASQCNTTLATVSTAIIADAVSGASHYRFEINGGAQYVTKTTRTLYLGNFTYALNTTYAIKVAYSLDGTNFSSYGAACNITSPASGMIQNPNMEEMEEGLMSDISVEAFPNPNDGNFILTSSHEGLFTVINELGQVIQTVDITKENDYRVKVENLHQGIYFVTGTVNNTIITKKLVVQ
ncbi:MAG: hypothetical protein K0R65_2235 [Crocinitomicaceae bacterium]|nr:hypothetical protein [Crocinitomicaceae bacterium]